MGSESGETERRSGPTVSTLHHYLYFRRHMERIPGCQDTWAGHTSLAYREVSLSLQHGYLK